jgi:hypothetical protein
MFPRRCFGTLTTFGALAIVLVTGSYSKSNSDAKDCLEAVETVLEHNSPGKDGSMILNFLKNKFSIVSFRNIGHSK